MKIFEIDSRTDIIKRKDYLKTSNEIEVGLSKNRPVS